MRVAGLPSRGVVHSLGNGRARTQAPSLDEKPNYRVCVVTRQPGFI
jgi:hypothetical protein